MAWINPSYTCGHEGRVQTFAPASSRYDIEFKLSQKPCPACRKAQQAEREAEKILTAPAGQWCRRCGGPVADGSGYCGEC